MRLIQIVKVSDLLRDACLALRGFADRQWRDCQLALPDYPEWPNSVLESEAEATHNDATIPFFESSCKEARLARRIRRCACVSLLSDFDLIVLSVLISIQQRRCDGWRRQSRLLEMRIARLHRDWRMQVVGHAALFDVYTCLLDCARIAV